jgi:2-dehydropantoate 2-reductase
MRIGVIGAGAMGSLFAAHLADAGAEVFAFDIWREHVEAIRRHGLAVVAAGRERRVALLAGSDAREAGTCQAVLVFVKFNQTRAGIENARPMIGPHTLIATLQNGIGNVELIQSLCPNNPIAFGLTTLTSELIGPGRIEASYAGHGETHLWPLGGAPNATVEQLCALLVKGGINAALAPDIELQIWKKLVVNCCLNTVCAVARASVGAVAAIPATWALLDGVLDEIVRVAERKGIPLTREAAHDYLRRVAEDAHAHEPSMLIDVRNNRPTEIECLNGAVLRECERFGITAPFNQSLYGLIRIIEQCA